MIKLLEEDWIYRSSGADNGTNFLGLATLDTDLRTGISYVVDARTVVAERTAYDKYSGLSFNRGQKRARCAVIGDVTYEYCDEFDPDIFGSESPFQHLHAASFEALLESQMAIDNAVYRWRRTLEFVKVPPGRAKKAVCPQGQYSNKKEDIQRFIRSHPQIVAGPGVDFEKLDEHAFDAITVARYLAWVAYTGVGFSRK